MNRRGLLTNIMIALPFFVTGCIREPEPTETDTETAEPETVEAIQIVLTNHTTTTQRGDLTLSADTETVFEAEFEIDTDD